MSRSDNIAKIIARMQGRIAEGSFYEAQQQTRVVVARHTKPAKVKAPADDVSEDEAAKKKRTPNWNAACDILYEVSKSLLQAGQGGSGGDLAIMLVDIYKQAADWEQNEYDRELRRARAKQAKSSEPVLMPEFTPKFVPDAANKGRLLSLLRLFDAGEPTRKKFVGEMISWSSAFGEFPAGDPELHHVAGSLFATEHDAIEAERHLILGTKDSPEILARMHYDWYKECEPHTAPMLCARSVLPYLLTANLRGANTAHRVFTSALSSDNPNLQVQDVSSSSCDIRIFPSLPLLNFLSMLLLTVQRGAPDLFRQLKQKYGADLAQVKSWDDALDGIADQYFGIQRPRQAPSLFDMMGSMFGGGMGGSMGGGPSRGARRVGGPAAEGLD